MKQTIIMSIELHELQEMIRETIKTELRALKDEPIKPNEPEYLTRKQVADKLNVTLPTIHMWSRNGTLKAYQIGGRVLYKTSELQNCAKPNKYR